MSAWLTLSEAAFAVTTLVCGVWLLRTRSATASGALLAVTGIGVFGVIGCAANGATQAVDIGLRITLGVLLSLAVACYPRVQAGVISLTLLSAVGLAGTVMVLAAPAVAWMPLAIVLFLLLAIWWAWENGEAHTRRALMWSTTAWLGACLLIALVSFTGDALAVTAVDPGPLVPLLGLFGPIAMVVGAVSGDVVDVRGIVTPLVVNATVVAVFVAVTVGGQAWWKPTRRAAAAWCGGVDLRRTRVRGAPCRSSCAVSWTRCCSESALIRSVPRPVSWARSRTRRKPDSTHSVRRCCCRMPPSRPADVSSCTAEPRRLHTHFRAN